MTTTNKATDQPIHRNNDYQLEEMDGEMLLYDPGNTRTIYLNETSALIWRLADGETAQSLVDTLSEAYPDEPSLEQDVMEALAQLQDFGAISTTTK